MSVRKLASILILVVASGASAADWPTFRRDHQRGGATDEKIQFANLKQRWVHRSIAPPKTAWPGPAKWDAYANIRGLRAMRNYDIAFGVSVVGRSVFLSSSSDDSVYCLDAASGKVKWSYGADGPVRIAPTVSNGLVLFGSDDGYVYCVRATDGSFVWKFRPPVDGPLILNNGRMISTLPCRTGVLVMDNIAYCAFSLLPWKQSYLCALDIKTGKSSGAGHYVTQLRGATFEGPMTATDSRLIAPQGRVAPRVFDRRTGKSTGSLHGKAGGGSFVLVTPDNRVLHGPGNKTGWITQSDPNTCKPVGTFKACSEMVIQGDRAYQLADHHITAVDPKTKKTFWKVDAPSANTLIANDGQVIVGAADYVAAFNTSDGKVAWRASVDGGVYELVVANGTVIASTDEGVVYCFAVDGKTPIRSERVLLTAAAAVAKSGQRIRARITVQRQPGMVNGWRFGSDMGVRAKRRGLADPKRRVADSVGRVDGKILGPVNLRQAGGIEAIELDGKTNSIMLAEDFKTARPPTRSISVEAWVRIDKTLKWGGIIGALQDNGKFERGWLLGYKGSKFVFALNGTGGPDKLTFLEAADAFKTGDWYHVVGTYDGRKQQLFVNGKLAASSTEQKGAIKYPPKAFFEIGAYHDDDEYFRMTGLIHEVGLYNRSLSASFIKSRHSRKMQSLPKPVHLAAGPYVRFADADTAVIAWRTTRPSASQVTVKSDNGSRVVTEAKLKTAHELKIDGLLRNRIYSYVIKTASSSTGNFELDTSFNYTPERVPSTTGGLYPGTKSTDVAKAAEEILSVAGVRQGICLVIGAGDGQLAYELVRRSDLRVIGVEIDPKKVAKSRAALKQMGVYGSRVAMHHVVSYDKLPFIGDFANLVINDSVLHTGKISGHATEYARMARPNGGMLLIGKPKAGFGSIAAASIRTWMGPLAPRVKDHTSAGTWVSWTKKPLVGAGVWSHQYGQADNSAFGGENLGGATHPRDFRVQWIGRPGPRAQPDRNGRKPSPLSTNGRLFVQGLHRLIALDAFNGSILWSLEIPPLERFNLPRDSSNWCADDNHVYVAIRDGVWRIDAQSGQVQKIIPVAPGNRKDFAYDWGYLGREGDHLIGSAVKRGSAYVEFWGKAGAGWYDARSGPITNKVCSENLFAMDPATGGRAWTYAKGVILNSTITMANGKVFFVECRNPKVKASNSRRVGMPELWQDQYLVALNVATGSKLYEKKIDTADGLVTFYMAHGSDKLAIAASADKKYHVHVFDAGSGKQAWTATFDWPGGKGDHGKAMNRPGIVGNRLYVRPKVMNLTDGKILGNMPGGGCGTYALSRNAAIYRSGSGGVMSLWGLADGGKAGSWDRLRPGCWLSTIPANGMLLSPEAGGGCSCGKWMETSIGFMPIKR